MNKQELLAKRQELLAAISAITEGANASERDLTDDEKADIDAKLNDADALQAEVVQIEADEKRQARLSAAAEFAAQAAPEITAPVDPAPAPAAPHVHVPNPAAQDFSSLGHMLQSVASIPGQRSRGEAIDPRLIPHAATGASEGLPSDGGFLVKTDWANELLVDAYNNSVVLNGGPGFAGCRRIPLSAGSNGTKINCLNETSRADGSRFGGIRAYWLNEGGTLTASKPTFRQIELNLKKLIGMSYATTELLSDAPALEAVTRAGFAEEFSFKIQEAIINGTGAGQPVGIMASGPKVAVPKETNQAAKTIEKANLDKMYARMKPSSLPRSVWFINNNVYPQLFNMSLAVGTGGSAAYMPPGGMSQAPYGMILGRPVMPIEQCATLGTEGDIIFADMSDYLFIEGGVVTVDSSIHVQFTTDEVTFRFVYRCDGKHKDASSLTPFKDASTSEPVSSIVTLAARA